MSELVERLREFNGYNDELLEEAADRITRLEADRVEHLRLIADAIQIIASDYEISSAQFHAVAPDTWLKSARRIKEN